MNQHRLDIKEQQMSWLRGSWRVGVLSRRHILILVLFLLKFADEKKREICSIEMYKNQLKICWENNGNRRNMFRFFGYLTIFAIVFICFYFVASIIGTYYRLLHPPPPKNVELEIEYQPPQNNNNEFKQEFQAQQNRNVEENAKCTVGLQADANLNNVQWSVTTLFQVFDNFKVTFSF